MNLSCAANYLHGIFTVFITIYTALVAQLEKNPPAIRETWVLYLGWEDSLEKGKPTHSSIPCLENSMDRGTWRATVQGVTKESDMTARLSLFTQHFHFIRYSKRSRDDLKYASGCV